MPETEDRHIWNVLKDDKELFSELKLNLMVNWLKHSNSPETQAGSATLTDFETIFVLARAITKFFAVYHYQGHPDLTRFMRWTFEAGHLPKPKNLDEILAANAAANPH